MLAGQKLHLATQRSGDADRDTAQSKLTDGWDRIDLERPPKLIDNDLVWFDPERGFVTDKKNLKPDGIDRAFPYIFAGAITAMTFGAGSTVAAGITAAAGGGTAGTIAVGAATGAVGSAALQLAANGRIDFGQLLQSALAGGVTAGLSHLPGVGQHIDGLAETFSQRLMEYTGRATVQGAIQTVMGGQFKDGFVNSLMGSVAGEVTAQLEMSISELQGQGLDAGQASALRLLTRATGSALRIVGSDDPAAGFAADFLNGVMGDALQAQAEQPAEANVAADAVPSDDPLGAFIVDNQDRWADRQAAVDQVIEAFSNPPEDGMASGIDLAAGPEFTGLGGDGEGLGPDGVYRVTITGTGASVDDGVATQELTRIDQVLASRGAPQGVTRAGLYNDLVVERFRDMSAHDQRAVLAALDDYANALHDPDLLTWTGLAPGSLEARRADLAVRIAADFARQSGAIPADARFPADARSGMETGLAAMIGAAVGAGKPPGRRGANESESPNVSEVGGPRAQAEQPIHGAVTSSEGAGRLPISFGRTENQISHTFRHVDAAGFDRVTVQNAVSVDLSRTATSLNPGVHNGAVIVNGTQLDYVAYKLPDGTINIGRITPPR
ncbi:MAG: hypothetical protein QM772_05775 [Ottowia sp.]|uniref:hypothetical protein n=1 Tax=Ottowia sp. TaxID=1898956 RepID=UPI0039E3AED3